jgi:cell division protein FtsZ
MAIEMIEIEEFNQGTQIKVIGVGGGGGNAIDYMMQRGVQGVDFICANTDAQALSRSSARRVVQLGTTGLGAGNKPEKAPCVKNSSKLLFISTSVSKYIPPS